MSNIEQTYYYSNEAWDINVVKCSLAADKDKFLDTIRLVVSDYNENKKNTSNIFFCFESAFTMEIINSKKDSSFPNIRNFKRYFDIKKNNIDDCIWNPGSIYVESNFERENDHIVLMINRMDVNDRSNPSIVAHACKNYFKLLWERDNITEMNLFLKVSDFVSMEDASETAITLSCLTNDFLFDDVHVYILDDMVHNDILKKDKKKNKKKKRG